MGGMLKFMIYPRNLGGEEVQIWESVGKMSKLYILTFYGKL